MILEANLDMIMTELNLEKRLQLWKEEFEFLYTIARDDALEALEECRLIHVAHLDIKLHARSRRILNEPL